MGGLPACRVVLASFCLSPYFHESSSEQEEIVNAANSPMSPKLNVFTTVVVLKMLMPFACGRQRGDGRTGSGLAFAERLAFAHPGLSDVEAVHNGRKVLANFVSENKGPLKIIAPMATLAPSAARRLWPATPSTYAARTARPSPR